MELQQHSKKRSENHQSLIFLSYFMLGQFPEQIASFKNLKQCVDQLVEVFRIWRVGVERVDSVINCLN